MTQMPQEPVVAPAYTAGVNPLAVDPATGTSLPATADDNTSQTSAGFGMPKSDPAVLDNLLSDETPQVTTEPEAPQQDQPVTDEKGGELLSLKQQALGELAPLVDHLEQTPEEKFRTTMMMIQSTDNQSLIKEAFTAAQAIPDDKSRAQALLDVINEINYFTQKDKQ